MNKLVITAAMAATLCLCSCGGKSEASKEQITKGHEQAKEMLQQTHSQQKATPVSEQADSAKQ